MENEFKDEVKKGINIAFVDSEYRTNTTNLAYVPQFVTNDRTVEKRVLNEIEDELYSCDSFCISVAFIKDGGLISLMGALTYLENHGIPGKILTTNYLTFSEPKAIRRLLEFTNLEVKLFDVDRAGEGFHTKGYIFKKDEIYRIIIGSSNITSAALTKNREWNAKLISHENGEMAQNILNEFATLWDSAYALDARSCIDSYEQIYLARQEIEKQQKELAKKQRIVSLQQYELKPNKMQSAFLAKLRELYENGAKKALLISATGTGKTYASAFAMRAMGFNRVLFIVHRSRIVEQAEQSFQDVYIHSLKTGFVGEGKHDYNSDFIFSTMQTMSKAEVMKNIPKDYFDAIIIDEAHHSPSKSYQDIMKYYEPKLWLGMTATPDKRNDYEEDQNVYKLFDNNIAYEIRLQQALEENLLCDFHYFGIHDIDGITSFGNKKEEKRRGFELLTSDDRVHHVMEQARIYGYSGDRVRGLMFCSRVKEAEELSIKFNKAGWRTAVVASDSKQAIDLNEAIERIKGPDRKDALDYIISVDKLSEGVDIPEVNQVLLLRATESPIVFIQQIGRGLRKAEGKDFVVIIDFIGNYKRNFLIPIALSGDRTFNKDKNRRFMREGRRFLPGGSTIHFDEISKQRIYDSISKPDGIKKILKDSYAELKYRLGRIPTLKDFFENGEVDPEIIIENYETYHSFLQVVEKEYKSDFSETQLTILKYFSRLLIGSKRPHEAVILGNILSGKGDSFEATKERLAMEFNITVSQAGYESAMNNISGRFVAKSEELEEYQVIEPCIKSFAVNERLITYADKLINDAFINQFKDLVYTSKLKCKGILSSGADNNGFVLYEKYSRRDVCQLMNHSKDDSSTMYGKKKFGEDTFIFINYEKKEYTKGKPDYDDGFENRQILKWDSQMGQTLGGKYMDDVLGAKRRHILIKKNDDEGADYYYMGLANVLEATSSMKYDKETKKDRKIAKVKFAMVTPVIEDLYDYIANDIVVKEEV